MAVSIGAAGTLRSPSNRVALMNLDPALLDILVCPQCRATLYVDHDADELVCNSCQLAYPVRGDIPIMLVDEARDLNQGN